MNGYLKLLFIVTLLTGIISGLYAQDYWVPLEKPTSKRLNKLAFLDSLTGWVAGDSGTVLKTEDGAQTWIFQSTNVDRDIRDIFILDENFGWALAPVYPVAADTAFGTIILRTTDGGVNWQQYMFPEKYFFAIFFHNPLEGWIGGDNGNLMGTTDGGLTWFEASVDPGVGSGFPIESFKFFSPQYGYAMGGHFDISGVVWKTTNGGDRWTPQIVGPEPLYDMYFEDSLTTLGIGGDFDFGSGMVKTTDGGITWEYIYLGIFGQARALSFRTETEAWSPLGFTGTYMYSLDAGRTWTDISTPGSSAIYDLVFTDSQTGFAVGYGGTVLKYKPVLVNIPHTPAAVPGSYELYPNYPNPFNPRTNLGFRIVDFGFVELDIFNVGGQKIATLVSKELPAGEYEFQWDGRDGNRNPAASGIYFYRLHVRPVDKPGNYSEIRKMILMR